MSQLRTPWFHGVLWGLGQGIHSGTCLGQPRWATPALPPPPLTLRLVLCHLFSPRSSSLFAFPSTALIPTSVGTLGEAGKHHPMARSVLCWVGI